MKNHSLALLLSALSFAPSIASATTVTIQYNALVKLHFDDQYNGKKVASVLAHVGLDRQEAPGWGGKRGWQDIQDITLSRKAGLGFTAIATLTDAVSVGSPGEAKIYGPVASFLVTYESGESAWVNDVKIPIQAVQCIRPNYGAVKADQDNLLALSDFIASGSKTAFSESIIISHGEYGSTCVESMVVH